MSRLDVVIFGATGFTGAKTVEEMVRIAKKYPGLAWGVAGRSQSKLEELMASLGKKTGANLSGIKMIVADVTDEQSIKDMCLQARVVANCAGPYRMYGEPVVKAAVEAKTHVVDVSGESQFIELMQLKYDQAAKDAGVYIISACGFDSIPNDMGLVYMQQKFDGTLNSVESYISSDLPREYQAEAKERGVINYGTWESLVNGLAHSNELGPLRRKLFPEKLPTFKPKLQPRSAIHKHEGVWCVPFMGTDSSIVYRTQRWFYENDHKRPVQFKPYFKLGGLITTAFAALAGVILFFMSKTSVTKRLLLNHPRFFSFGLVTRQGPSENVMNNTKFQFQLFGEGWERGVDVEASKPNKKAVVTVKGVNPGYGATVTALLFSALTCLKESDKMPGTGGVLTTGAAFSKTDLIKNLNENNLTFEFQLQ
ncbi:saccharopine dehydrogenase-like oxidoreductase [Choristoneura fumiferana]|uniref:saccharopine dehydrogenase-like oxidoreductase n=1 Tax=Choristoneura fumiferana TaxID=7141 RepID=UPI003D1585BA